MVFKTVLLMLLANACFSEELNLLSNPDFEEPYTNSDWQSWSSTVTQYADDAYTGMYSYKISNNPFEWSSIVQFIDPPPNTVYSVSVMVKILSQSTLGEKVELRFIYDENGVTYYVVRGGIPSLTAAQGWQNITGSFRTGTGMSNIRVNVRSNPNVEYLVDTASMTESQILLWNPGCETPLTNTDWVAMGSTITQYAGDAYSGTYSCKVSNTPLQWSSISQNVYLQPNTLYSVSLMVKLLSQSDAVLGERVVLQFVYDEDGVTKWKARGFLPNLRMDQGWQKLSADFYTSADMSNIFINVKSNPNVEYLVDAVTMDVIDVNPDWRKTAKARIEQLRKNNIVINLNIDDDNPHEDGQLYIHLTQKTHDFPFGSVVNHHALTGTEPDNEKYRNTFFSNFNWAVIENKLKWRSMEWTRGNVIYPDESIDMLTQRGIPVRGHNVFWDVADNFPDWLKSLTKSEVLAEMSRRIEYLIPRYNHSLVHWDVNNEQEHGKWFEEKTEDPYIMDWMFRQVNARAPTTSLFLNDFQILTSGTHLQTYVNTAQGMLARGVPVHAMGIQGHFGSPPNMGEILHRLDKAAEAGLPIWITELDLVAQNENALADGYDDLVTAFFSHPAVDGILLWGFAESRHWRSGAALFEGPNYTPNAAGLRWQKMMTERYRTVEQYQICDRSKMRIEARGFYGTYDLQVIYNGHVIKTEEFHLQTGAPVTVNINLDEIGES